MSDKIVDQPTTEENKPVQVRRSQRIQERNEDAKVSLQRIESLVSVYHTAPEALWQTAATRALEVNALLLAAVVGEQQQHKGRKSVSMRIVVDDDITTSASLESEEEK